MDRVDAVKTEMDDDGDAGRKKEPRVPSRLVGAALLGSGPSSRFKGALIITLAGPKTDLGEQVGTSGLLITMEVGTLRLSTIPSLFRRFDRSLLLQGADSFGWIL